MRCSHDHEMDEVERSRDTTTIEEVVYAKERIKHFDRNGSEYWAEVSVPELVEKQVEVERIRYLCPECNENKTVEEPVE